jgi:ketosteroid isomerase-like protein
MKRIAIAVSMVALVLAVGAQAQIPAQKETGSVEQELIRLENEWMEAGFKQDTVSIEKLSRMMADELIQTFDGSNFTKAQIIELVKSRTEELLSFVMDEWNVRVYGDVAVVMARNTYKMRLEGKETTGQIRFTDTWIKRDGRWQCVAAHNSTIAQK